MKGLVEAVRKRIKEFDITCYEVGWVLISKDKPVDFCIERDHREIIYLNDICINDDVSVSDKLELTKMIRDENEVREARKHKEAVSLLKKWIKHGSKALEG